jgi:PAS domain S-box-containing protein
MALATMEAARGSQRVEDERRANEQLLGRLKELHGRVARLEAESARAEEALRESQERFMACVRDSAYAYVEMDLQGNLTFANRRAAEYTGHTTELLCGMHMSQLLAAEDLERANADLAKVLTEPNAGPIEYRFRHKDGSFLCGETNTLLLQKAGTPVGFQVTVANVTGRKQAEEELRKSQRMLRLVLDTIPACVFWKDRDSVYLGCNRKFSQAIGLGEPEEVIGKTDHDIFRDKEMADRFRDWDRRVMATDTPMLRLVERWSRAGSAEQMWAETSKIPLHDNEGSVVGILGTYEDITDRKRAEEDLDAHRQRLRSLASEISLAEERERRRIAVGLHDNVAQDLIAATTQLADCPEGQRDPRCAKCVGDVQENLQKAIHQVRTLTFELGSTLLYECGLVAALDEAVEDFQETHGIRSSFEDDGVAKPLGPDLGALVFRAVRELLVNVAKHASASRLTVSTTRDDEGVKVVVEDDGDGFDVAAAASAAGKAMKFGLFGIRERLEYLGGEMRLESEPGHGARITLVVPLKDESHSALPEPRQRKTDTTPTWNEE